MIKYSKIIQIELSLNYNSIYYKLVDCDLNKCDGFVENLRLNNYIFQINDGCLIANFNPKEAKEVIIEKGYESLTIN